MIRQASSTTILKHVMVVFVFFFAVFALLNTGLSFIYQPLFTFLMSVPTFTTIALFALILTLIIRQTSVADIPNNTIGLVTYANGALKTLAPPGPTWVWFGREQLRGFLSLETVSAHMPLMGLRSGDGEALAPLVMILSWGIHEKMTTLFFSQFRQQVAEVALESQLKRERRVRDTVAGVMRRRVGERLLADLEEDLANMHQNSFGKALVREVNAELNSIGLKVERVECIGSITRPSEVSGGKHRSEASKTPSRASEAAIEEVQRRADDVLSRARRAAPEMLAATKAVEAYVQAVLDVAQQAQGALKRPLNMQAAGAAQKAQSERMRELAAEIYALLEAAGELKEASERMNARFSV
ncbi:MAG TPA: SPFH domain-containing protein [Ktedonobacterales bacterium]|jgi:hypothetical protein